MAHPTQLDTELHFPNAPITEAVLELRVTNPPDIHFDDLDSFVQAIASEYPEKSVRMNVEANIHFDKEKKEVSTEGSGTPIGFLLKSADGLCVVQPRVDLFGFSRLRPYETWAALRDEARRLWDTYWQTFKPTAVTRIALRYINRVEIPVPAAGLAFKDYFLTAPEIAEGISQQLPNFFMRLVVPDTKGRGTAIITETVDPKAPSPNIFALIFDVDVFREGKYDPDSDQVWDALEELRTLKNEIFTLSFTDKAKELFK